jgi:hypothetical protein
LLRRGGSLRLLTGDEAVARSSHEIPDTHFASASSRDSGHPLCVGQFARPHRARQTAACTQLKRALIAPATRCGLRPADRDGGRGP